MAIPALAGSMPLTLSGIPSETLPSSSPSSVTVRTNFNRTLDLQDGWYCATKTVDGDTINVLPELVSSDASCVSYDEHAKVEKVSLRFNGVNTTECGKSGSSREEKCDDYGEPGANDARDFTRRLVGNGPVYLDLHEADSYGRAVTTLYIKDPNASDGSWMDINEALIRAGYGFPYFIEGDPQFLSAYLAAAREAQGNHSGLWALPDWQGRHLILTSYHGERKGKDEYARILNLSTDPLSTEGYFFEYEGNEYPLVAADGKPFTIPPGRTVRMYAGFGTDQLDPAAGSLDVYLRIGADTPTHDSWTNDHPLILKYRASNSSESQCVWPKVNRFEVWSDKSLKECPQPKTTF